MLRQAISAAIDHCRQYTFLVLRRNYDESIYVDGPCLITVVNRNRRGILLGFQAPKTTHVVRAELVETIGNEGEPIPLASIVAKVIESQGDHQEVS